MKRLHKIRKTMVLFSKICKSELRTCWREHHAWQTVLQMLIKSRARLLWAKLWIRKDSFHSTLRLDCEMLGTTYLKQRKSYLSDLSRRRSIANRRDVSEYDREMTAELIRRLNQFVTENPTVVVENYARECNVACESHLVSSPPKQLREKILIVNFKCYSFMVKYSGFFYKKWKIT